MFTHLISVAKKLQTQPLFLFPEEEEMFERVNKVFGDQDEVKECVKNLQFKLYEDENEKEIFEGKGFLDDDVDRYESEEVKMANFFAKVQDSLKKLPFPPKFQPQNQQFQQQPQFQQNQRMVQNPLTQPYGQYAQNPQYQQNNQFQQQQRYVQNQQYGQKNQYQNQYQNQYNQQYNQQQPYDREQKEYSYKKYQYNNKPSQPEYQKYANTNYFNSKNTTNNQYSNTNKYYNNNTNQNYQKYSNRYNNNQNNTKSRYKIYSRYNYNSFQNPNHSNFNYKPSYYNYYDKYEQKKPSVNDMDQYSKYYNDKYGKRIRRIKITDLNKKINKRGNVNDQYWYNRKDTNGNQFNTDFLNSLISKKDNTKKLDDDTVDGSRGQKIFISGLINKLVDKKKKEEEEINDKKDDDKPQGEIINNMNHSFSPSYFKNQLDDLQELLNNSVKYKSALNKVYNGKFTDSEFKGDPYSIYGFGERNDYSLQELNNLPWLRPEVFFAGKQIKLYDTIHSNDIEQGGLGDCYFLAAISAIAEFPERLERLFLKKTYQQNGIYVVALCVDGIWQDVILDDLVPCTKYSKKPAFNRSKSSELWVILLEKAWAKVHGGYMNIAAGLTREALRDLTGASAITYFTSQKREELWEKLVEANASKHIMTAGSDDLNNGSDSYIEKIGIAGSHAYSLLEVYEIEKLRDGRYKVLTPAESKQGMRIERLVKLRNPWGKGEWKGDWSDSSYLWTAELKQQLNYEDTDDGVFYMTYNDFVKYYSDIQICYYHDGFKYSAVKLQSEKNGTVFLRFKIEIKGKYYLSLNQKNRRHFPKKKKYAYTNCGYIVARQLQNGKYDYIGGNMKADKENWIGEECDIGEYVVMIKTPWKSFVNEFSFSIYGLDKTDIKQTNRDNLPKNFIQGILTSHALEDTSNQLTSFAKQNQPDILYKTFDNRGGYGYIFFQNNSKSTILEASVEMLGSVNINTCSPFTGLRPSVEVKPGEHELIPYEAKALPYSTQMRMMTTFKNSLKAESLKSQVKKSSTVLTKSFKGSTLDIKVYVLYHANGLALLYENNESDYSISEELEFDLEGCHIDGVYGNYIEVVVGPGKERLLKVVKDDGVGEFTAKIKKLFYNIK